jgi:hypothetical protein
MSTATIGLTGEIDLRDYKYFALEMSTAWTASPTTVLASAVSGGTKLPLNYAGAVVSLASSANQLYDLSTCGLSAVRYIELQSTATQEAERTLRLICKK